MRNYTHLSVFHLRGGEGNFLIGYHSHPYQRSRERNYLHQSLKEVLEAITSLKSGKAPGPDGLCPEFYKKLSHLIVEPLTDMFLDSFENGHLPPTLNLANITLILKKDKPPSLRFI